MALLLLIKLNTTQCKLVAPLAIVLELGQSQGMFESALAV